MSTMPTPAGLLAARLRAAGAVSSRRRRAWYEFAATLTDDRSPALLLAFGRAIREDKPMNAHELAGRQRDHR